MNQQEKETVEHLTGEESVPCADLDLTDEQMDEIKAGAVCHGTTVLAWARVDGVGPSTNHNETVVEEQDDDGTAAELTDLAMRDEQSGKVQGGITRTDDDNNHGTHVAGTIGAIGSGGAGGLINHNETTAEDEDTEASELDDLAIEADEQIKGGSIYKVTDVTLKRGVIE
jgi:subtilisin family serine protease